MISLGGVDNLEKFFISFLLQRIFFGALENEMKVPFKKVNFNFDWGSWEKGNG